MMRLALLLLLLPVLAHAQDAGPPAAAGDAGASLPEPLDDASASPAASLPVLELRDAGVGYITDFCRLHPARCATRDGTVPSAAEMLDPDAGASERAKLPPELAEVIAKVVKVGAEAAADAVTEVIVRGPRSGGGSAALWVGAGGVAVGVPLLTCGEVNCDDRTLMGATAISLGLTAVLAWWLSSDPVEVGK